MQNQSETRPSIENALKVLELFAQTNNVSFERLAARRALDETAQAISGETGQAWAGRLVEVGESVNLRIRSVECTLREALTFAGQGIPIAVCLEQNDNHDESDASPRDLDWLVLTEATARGVHVKKLGASEQDGFVSFRRLRKILGVKSNRATARWIIGQAALGCQAPGTTPGHQSSTDAGLHPITPMARLLGLIRPEKSDLWVVLIFSIVVGILALATPVAVEALVNTVAFGRYLQPVVILALLLFTFLSFAAAIRGLIAFLVEIFQRRLFIRVVEDLAYRLPRAKHEQFDRRYGPELVNRFFDVITIQKVASALLLDGISIILQTVIGMAVLGFYHPFLLGFDVVLLALILFIVFGLGRGAVRTAVKESKAKFAIASWLQELSRHPTTFKLHSGNQFALERADQLAVNWLEARRVHFRIVIRQILFALGLQAVAATALLGLGGWLVISGELTLGQLVASELIVMIIVGSFAKLGKHMESFYDLLASVDKLGLVLDLDTEPHDKLFHLREGEPAQVNVRGVSYSYGGKKVIDDCNLLLQPGEKVALTGPAGSGKSSLIDILCGLRPPASGHVELDGIDLRELRPDSLREHLSLARSIEIFPGTIDENVHLGRPNVRARDVRDALEMVGLLDEVLQLPDGLNSKLLTDGAPLTHGQAIRLMLARAIVGRPRLLLLDGTLDAVPDSLLDTMLARLTAKNTPWTLLISSGRQRVLDACQRVESLQTGAVAPSFGTNLVNQKEFNDSTV